MTNKYDWLLKKNLRSVDALRLWPENPRLNPEYTYYTIRDYAEEMTATDADRTNFIKLAKSIWTRGFIPADPIVVWQNETNHRYYVAEGNRRVLVLKLLRSPSKAPRSIRGIFLKMSSEFNKKDLKKIPVSVAPTFEDAEWYISQRNSTSSLQKRWSHQQQKRWVVELYNKHDGNIDIIRGKIEITEPELKGIFRILKLKDFIKDIKHGLTDEEYRTAIAHTFPLSTFERFFNFKDVRDLWGVEFDEYDVKIISNFASFLKAFTQLIKRMLLNGGDSDVIDSRTISTAEDALNVLRSLPTVDWDIDDPEDESTSASTDDSIDDDSSKSDIDKEKTRSQKETERRTKLKDDPSRTRLICEFYSIETDSHKLLSLFNELKKIPLHLYPNSTSASIRIILDLAVFKHIETENLKEEIRKFYKRDLRHISLRYRMEFIKQKITDTESKNILGKLLNPVNEYSLDVLNGYVHGKNTHYLNRRFLNGFWDFLFPLFDKLMVIKEDPV